MPIQLRCPNPNCGLPLTIPDEYAGKAGRCKTCNTRFQVPSPDADTERIPGSAGRSLPAICLSDEEGPDTLDHLGDYQVLRKLGQGGMGVVYEAVQTKLDRKVALKVLPKESITGLEFMARFEREAKSAAALNHANVVQVYDIGEEDGILFFSMEFVDGEDLHRRQKKMGQVPVPEALFIIEEVAKALRYAKSQAIIHRDIKPANIMVTRKGQVKLTDLGLSKSTQDDVHLTQTGVGLGTPHFMAPEQAEDASKADHRSDIYSLGITLMYLVTGRLPFDGTSAYAVVLAHARRPMPTAADLGASVPAALEALIQKMCAKDPSQRHQDYDALLTDIQWLRSGLGQGTDPGYIPFTAPTLTQLDADQPDSNAQLSPEMTPATIPLPNADAGGASSAPAGVTLPSSFQTQPTESVLSAGAVPWRDRRFQLGGIVLTGVLFLAVCFFMVNRKQGEVAPVPIGPKTELNTAGPSGAASAPGPATARPQPNVTPQKVPGSHRAVPPGTGTPSSAGGTPVTSPPAREFPAWIPRADDVPLPDGTVKEKVVFAQKYAEKHPESIRTVRLYQRLMPLVKGTPQEFTIGQKLRDLHRRVDYLAGLEYTKRLREARKLAAQGKHDEVAKLWKKFPADILTPRIEFLVNMGINRARGAERASGGTWPGGIAETEPGGGGPGGPGGPKSPLGDGPGPPRPAGPQAGKTLPQPASK